LHALQRFQPLLEQAAERFDAMALAWYAAQTRETLVGML